MNSRLLTAQAKVTEAREALIETAREIQLRLQPKTIAREAWESAKVKGADLAEDAVDAVKRRPVATGGIIAAVAMFLARGPITDGVSKLYGAMTSDGGDDGPPPAPNKPEPTAKKPAATRTTSAPRPRRKMETEHD